MKIEPNIGKAWRVGYVIVGLALVAAPFVMNFGGWEAIAAPIVGVVTAATGGVGW